MKRNATRAQLRALRGMVARTNGLRRSQVRVSVRALAIPGAASRPCLAVRIAARAWPWPWTRQLDPTDSRGTVAEFIREFRRSDFAGGRREVSP